MTTLFFLFTATLWLFITGTTAAKNDKWSACKNIVCDQIHEVQTEVEAATSELTAIQADLSLVKSDVGTVTTNLANIQNDISIMKSDVATVKSDMSTATTDLSLLKTDLSTVTQTVASMSSQMVTATSDLTTVKSNITTVTSDVENIKYDLATLQRDMDHIQQLLLALAYERSPLDKWGYHQYGFPIYVLNWTEHMELAKSCGGHLVTITSLEQNELLANFAFSQTQSRWPYFIGAYKDAGVWKWQEDNSTLTYTNWIGGSSEPPGDDDCAIFSMATGQVGSWFDSPCESGLLAIYGFRQSTGLTDCDPNIHLLY